MLVGGVMLAVVATAFGEPRRFHPAAVSGQAWFALVYLIVMGSIIGFTSYLWLIHRESPTKVGTYAYVNPVVAVLLGYFLGGRAAGSAHDSWDGTRAGKRAVDYAREVCAKRFRDCQARANQQRDVHGMRQSSTFISKRKSFQLTLAGCA